MKVLFLIGLLTYYAGATLLASYFMQFSNLLGWGIILFVIGLRLSMMVEIMELLKRKKQ